MRDRGLVPSSRVLAFDVMAADEGLAHGLRIGISEPVVRFTRLRLGSDEPMAVETTWIPGALAPGLGPADLEGSLYELLARRYRLAPGSASVTIEPVLPDPAIRRLLGIPARQACLRLRMTDADTRGRVIMIADCIYRGDRYQLGARVASGATPTLRDRSLD
jgi:GntR family transcriptional regulator